jgi:RNA polymerase sigma-70 factor (ECF subfamily)
VHETNVGELIGRAKAGDETARECLFQVLRHRLRQWAATTLAKQLGPAWDLSDAVQDSLAEASQDFSSFRGQHEGELLCWAKQILNHTIVDYLRRQNRRKRNAGRLQSLEAGDATGTPLRDQLPGDETSISRRVIRVEETIGLRRMVERLPEDQATAVRLRHLEGLPVDEVARRMNRSASSVAGLLIRALRRLRELAAEEIT